MNFATAFQAMMLKIREEGADLPLSVLMIDSFNKGFEAGLKDGAVDAREEVLGFLQRTGASVETLKAWLEKGEHES